MNAKVKILVNDILGILNDDKNVLSGTVVGSVLEKPLNEISDIDIIVILKKLNPTTINTIKSKISDLQPEKYNIERVFEINDSFGPIKIENDSNLIFHLMLYDEKLHIEHVKNSPFTCFDWERSKLYVKKSLTEIYPARKLFLNDFYKSRRGIQDYISDINSKKVSYRTYVETSSGLVQKKRFLDLDSKHSVEFGYHIIRNSINNILKILYNNNTLISSDSLLRSWKLHFPALYENYSEIFKELEKQKIQKTYKSPELIELIPEFLLQFNKCISEIYDSSQKIYLIRHLETEKNDGRFFGQQSDISILNTEKSFDLDSIDISKMLTISSPMLRSTQTVDKFGIKEFELDQRLIEIDYGKADGMFYEDFITLFPEYRKKIKQGIDFRFPGGESYKDLYQRVSKVIDSYEKDLVIFTHQGPIRSLIGSALNIPFNELHKISVPHAVPLEFIKIKNNLHLNIDRETIHSIL